MTIEIISKSISMKVWDQAGIKLLTPGSAVRLVSVARQVTDCAMQPSDPKGQENKIYTIVKGRETFDCRHTVPITRCSEVKYVLKKVTLWKQRMHERTETSVCKIFWARLASFGHLGLISEPLIVSKFHNETHDPKGQENKIYSIVKGRETFYCRHTVPVTSCSEVKYVLQRVSFGSKELKLECAYFLGQTS